MLTAIRRRINQEEEGFTLIELMVVVLIIAILLAIAIPTFLGARNAANARAAQSNLRNALTAEQTYYTNNQSWDTDPSTATAGSVAAEETALTWTTTAGVKPGNSILVSSDSADNGVVMTAAGQDGHCYSIEAIDQPASTGIAAGTYYYESSTTTASSGCSAPTGGPTGTLGTSAAKSPGTWSTAF